MKQLLFVILSFVLVLFLTTSCDIKEEEVSFDETLIIGKWKSGTVYERYESDNTGATWDTSDDVTEAEAQGFTWTLEIDQLEQIHIIENGGKIPKIYTVKTLNESTLVYEDDFGSTKTFQKQ